jgi:hypothetical protein
MTAEIEKYDPHLPDSLEDLCYEQLVALGYQIQHGQSWLQWALRDIAVAVGSKSGEDRIGSLAAAIHMDPGHAHGVPAGVGPLPPKTLGA